MILTKESQYFQELLEVIEKMKKDINDLKNAPLQQRYIVGTDPYDKPPKAIIITESTLYNLFKDFTLHFYSRHIDDAEFEIYKFLKQKGYFKQETKDGR